MPTSTTAFAQAMARACEAGEMERVIALAAQAADANAEDESVLLLLGVAQQASGRHAAAAATFERLTRLRPGVSAYWNNLGVARREAGETAASALALEHAAALAPRDAEVHYNLGLLQLQQRRWPQARASLMEAVQLAPGFVEARLQAAHACYVCGDNTGQEAMLEGAADWPPQPAEQALLLASMLAVLGRPDAAWRTLDQAQLPAEPAAEAAMRLRIAAQRALLHERGNRPEAAHEALRLLPLAALDALPPEATQLCIDGWKAHAALAMRAGAHAEAAGLYRRLLAAADDDETRANAGFGLAAACDKQGERHAAWQALETAHAAQLEIARAIVPQLLAPDSEPLQLARQRVDADEVARWSPLPAPDAAHSPVFVVGFPRSGTTLLEQMLDAHPAFRSMDERAFIHELSERMELVGQRYPADLATLSAAEADQLRALYGCMVARVLPDAGSSQLVDKNPLNMLCLPMIMRLFPRARIILCLRHPCDVLLSCYMQSFRSPAFMVLCSSLPRLARGYVQAFEQWQRHVEVFAPQLLEWRYEAVVGDFDGHVAQLGRFLDIADPAPMARYAEHARAKAFISTPSYAQVTAGIHGRAVGRWQAYREHFEPVLPLLRPMIERLGYAA
ncbi:MAG TPA: sulfotransferase [Rhodanobacter sp.]|nr:sulfotransferase [Rhodanobacter sp.]